MEEIQMDSIANIDNDYFAGTFINGCRDYI
jgi:hypothetical protein